MKVKLNQAFDLQMGKTPSRNIAEYWGGDHKWVSIADIGNAGKYISETKECITDDGVSGSGIKVVPKGTVIMSFKLSIGKTAITSEDMYTNEAIMAFIDKGIYPVDPNYLYHLCYGTDWTAGTNKAVMGLTLNKATLSEKMINLPSVEEQKDIAEKLDEVDSLINIQQRQLAKLDELVKSRFIELFGDRYINDRKWENKPLHECADFYNGKAHEQVVDENGEYILVTSRCIASDITDYRRTNALLFPLQVNDIAMVMSDVPNGRALAKCILIDEDRKYTLNQRICCLRNYSFNPVFFYHLLNRHEYFLSFNDGNAQTNLRKDDLLACSIIMPPIELQEQFATLVGQTDKSKLAVKQSLEKLETLKKSLMQQYFGV